MRVFRAVARRRSKHTDQLEWTTRLAQNGARWSENHKRGLIADHLDYLVPGCNCTFATQPHREVKQCAR